MIGFFATLVDYAMDPPNAHGPFVDQYVWVAGAGDSVSGSLIACPTCGRVEIDVAVLFVFDFNDSGKIAEQEMIPKGAIRRFFQRVGLSLIHISEPTRPY